MLSWLFDHLRQLIIGTVKSWFTNTELFEMWFSLSYICVSTDNDSWCICFATESYLTFCFHINVDVGYMGMHWHNYIPFYLWIQYLCFINEHIMGVLEKPNFHRKSALPFIMTVWQIAKYWLCILPAKDHDLSKRWGWMEWPGVHFTNGLWAHNWNFTKNC